MPRSAFVHHDLELPDIPFSSPLTDLVLELDHFRGKELTGSTHPLIFHQLKTIFHMMESIGSARIEGNNTTIAEFIETKLDSDRKEVPYGIREILNLEEAMAFIEKNAGSISITKEFIVHIFKMILYKTSPGEGVTYVGGYRKTNVVIEGVRHNPPDTSLVERYMQELLNFIARPDGSKFDLIKIALAHHRFVWIHPFTDGNGRTVRMLTHAMLVKYGFGGPEGRIVNPTAVFCIDRKAYYRNLAMADEGGREGILAWCGYFLNGLKLELEKVNRLLDYNFLKKEILLPAVHYARERQVISELEKAILKRAIDKQVIQASDISDLFPGQDNAIISRRIRKMIDDRMFQPEREGARKYVIRFANGYLLRGIVNALSEKGFLAINEEIR